MGGGGGGAVHYENTPMQKYRDFCFHIKMKISVEKLLYFPYFCSKHRLWVHVRTATVLTSTHNLCFGPKIRKNRIPLHTQFYHIKVGLKGVFIARKCFLMVYINNPGHMTRMAAMSIYGKNPLKIFFSGTGG